MPADSLSLISWYSTEQSATQNVLTFGHGALIEAVNPKKLRPFD